jgi:precorrin-2 dehydrogenase/sirohydrochlorin ferrochelatase
MLDGAQLRALVVGGGGVATRKVRSLLAAGATVRVVAPAVAAGLAALEREDAVRGRLRVERRAYESGDVGDALLVVAATDARDVNARVAADARALGRLVNVADAPEEGNCATAATHRAGDLTIAVSAGGVPGVAVRVRDLLAVRFDGRYERALARLVVLRRRLLGERGAAAWREAADVLVGDDFCAAVETGVLEDRAARWA